MGTMNRERSRATVVEPALRTRLSREVLVAGDEALAQTPLVPQWAMSMTEDSAVSRDVALRVPGRATLVPCEVRVRTGPGAGLVSVELEVASDWSAAALDATVEGMITISIESLCDTAFTEPVRMWNFVPGIGMPMGDGLDRYRVFNVARHRAFVSWFGEAAIADGLIPTASCVGHGGGFLSIHALGTSRAGVPVENPRQIPAFAYSTKFGPKPPYFSRAGLVEIGSKQLLLVAGTASVRGEESVHDGSVEAQLCETVLNLRTVVACGIEAAGMPARDCDSPLQGVRSTRVYCRRPEDMPLLKRLLPSELVRDVDVEFVLADLCRPELLVEIEIVVDVPRA